MAIKPFGLGATQINRGILERAFTAAHATGVPGMSIGLKTSIRNQISNSRNKTGTFGTINSELDQFTKFGGRVPPRGTMGPNPNQGGRDLINASTDYADDVRTGDLDIYLPTRVPQGTVSRSAPATRNMSSAQKGAMIARKRKKSGPKGGMR